MDYDREFPFELRVCEWAERAWPPAGVVGSERSRTGGVGSGRTPADGRSDPERLVIVGRQVGTRRRRWDTVVAIADRPKLRQRAAFGDRPLDADLLRVVRHAPADWQWYRDALPQWTAWRYVREHVHRAGDRELIDRRRRDGRIQIRRRRPYPDWCDRLIAIENKPDLDASAADALCAQLERDVAMALAEEVWVATRATGERVEPGLLADRPVEAGVLAIDPDALDARVLWHPRELPVDDPGTRILDRPTGTGADRSAARFEYVAPGEKARLRRVLAERVYGRGWRSFVDSVRPDCRHFQLRNHDGQFLPYCACKERSAAPQVCSGGCPEFEPEPPGWRTRNWPIEGGPGRLQRQLLETRRSRRRPDGEDS